MDGSPTEPRSTAAPAPPVIHLDALPPGTRLAEFEIESLLGVGGFGLVYRAHDHILQRPVAIKEYMPSALAARKEGLALSVRSSTDEATYQSGLQSFIAEARLLAQLDHPGLVKVYRCWEANNTAYMVMPLYRGMTLKQARSLMPAPPPEAWLRTVLWPILQALQYLHERDTLHRDVSPDNIFLQDVGPPVLLDLGAARRAIGGLSHKLTAILKIQYAPIEQYAGAGTLQQGPWSDLYALAAVVHGVLRNDAPVPATARVVEDSLPPMRQLAQTLQQLYGLTYSDPFVRAIDHALAVQPAQRPQSVAAFVQEMALQPPQDLARFDWRAAWGPGIGAGDSPATGADSAEAPTVVQQPTVDQAAPTRPPPRPAAVSAAPAPRRRAVWALGGVALLALAAAYFGLDDGQAWVAAPEPAPTPRLAPQPAAQQDAAGPPPDAAPAPPAAVAGPAASASAPPAGEAAAAPPRPAARAGRPATQPKPLCPDASVWARPLCLFRECLKPENLNHPVCVESRRSPPPASP